MADPRSSDFLSLSFTEMHIATPYSYGWSLTNTVDVRKVNWFLPKASLITVSDDIVHSYGERCKYRAPIDANRLLRIFIHRLEDGRAVMEDILRFAPSSQSRFVHFEIGLQYFTGFIWHLKEKAAEDFGWTGTTRGISEGIGSKIKRESVPENRWRIEHIPLRTRRQVVTMGANVRRNPKRAVRGSGASASP